MEDEEEYGWYCGGSKTLADRRVALSRAGVCFSVAQETEASNAELFAKGSGGIVWEAADALLRWLDVRYAPSGLKGCTVVELGAGTGVCGLACAMLGAKRVILTDLPEVCSAIAPLFPTAGSSL